MTTSPGHTLGAADAYVRETGFGRWFLNTETWAVHVVKRALDDLERLIPDRRPSYAVVLDIGCGWGHSLLELAARFRPQHLIGIDIDLAMVQASARRLRESGVAAELRQGAAARLPVGDASVDLLFCHQTFHHLVDQDAAIAEFHRVLRPGGLLLFAESTRAYIDSWIIRLLFRHPMDVQKTAPEYLALVRAAGFHVAPAAVSYPYLWWSRADLGLAERLLGIAPPATREETLINLVGVRG